jgi:hypothetical protein
MFAIIAVPTGAMLRIFCTRRNLLLENLVHRQQLAVLKRKRPRPRIAALDKLFWVLARGFWSSWKQTLIVVTPDTVVRWHRAGFALYWRAISRARRVFGRNRISKEVRHLIFRMVDENPTSGVPRIHGELLMLGFDVSERTISRWMRRGPRNSEPAKRWLMVGCWRYRGSAVCITATNEQRKLQTLESATLRLAQSGRAMPRRRNLSSQLLLNVFRSDRVEVKARCERMRFSNFDAGWNFGEAQVSCADK